MDVPSGSAARAGRTALFLWGVLRLPALLMVLYLARNPIVTLIERQFDILSATRFVIDVLSTPVSRAMVAAVFAGVLLGLMAATRRLGALASGVVVLGAAGALIVLSGQITGTSLRRGLVVLVILALNLAPRALPRLQERFARVWNGLMLAGAGIAELLFARDYWCWLRTHVRGEPSTSGGPTSVAAAVPAVVIASLALGVLVRGQALLPLEQDLRMSRDARVLDRGLSFNWIELDDSGRLLYVTGHSLPHLRRYAISGAPAVDLESNVSTGGAQGFAFDRPGDEIYAFNTKTRQLLYLDAATLEATRTLDIPSLSPGDPWIVVDGITDTLTIVSEADLQTGDPFIVVDRRTGEIVQREPLDAGNVLLHPTRPWVYLTFFRRRTEVIQYDLEARAVTRRAPADARAERMVFWREMNELLVTSPLESRVLRYDADTLEPKGFMPALFGVRAIAIDDTRGLLLCGNIATGHLVVIDARTGARVKRHYLGPWLRTISLRPESGMAYISSNGALYALRYASPSPARPPEVSAASGSDSREHSW